MPQLAKPLRPSIQDLGHVRLAHFVLLKYAFLPLAGILLERNGALFACPEEAASALHCLSHVLLLRKCCFPNL